MNAHQREVIRRAHEILENTYCEDCDNYHMDAEECTVVIDAMSIYEEFNLDVT